ncbi:cytochrome P450 [Gilbertella persicaria]|uniref:cytochrome P450 n=1 Tax=Gilbertella persicaria TaxID=101096 RepID=UPI0022205209|nr:cytochrome P450 [Gilbertella persicaria]KAI8062339.1 cytochrome P450 [Gilbertella persicaria]
MDYDKALGQIEQATQHTLEYLSNRANLEKIGKITAISLATYVTLNKLYDAFLGPLSHIPGPFYTRFFKAPNFVLDRPAGTAYKKFKQYHEKYGDIVRLGPDRVAIGDKDMIKQVLVTEDLKKGPVYKVFSKNKDPTLFSTRDHVWHKQRRRIVSPAFSIKYLNSMEPFMTSVTESLINKVDKEIMEEHDQEGYGAVDIWSLMQRLALDVIGETAFGQTFNMIEDPTHFVPKAIGEELKANAISALYPWLSKLFIKSSDQINPDLRNFLTDVINDRLKSTAEKRSDILQFLINSQEAQDQQDRLTSEAIMTETVLFLIAGSETTSNTIGFAFHELLKYPNKLKKLYEEIDAIPMKEGQKVFEHEQLKHLPYLNAVINETLRIDAVATSGLERITDKPVVLGDRLALPKDIVVVCSLYHTQTDEKHWPHPWEFKPERWLAESNTEASHLDAFFPFSSGSRNCIGKNFALQEMRISIATFLKHFDIAPIEQEMQDAEDRRHFITLQVAKNSFKLKAKRRQ